MRDVHVRTPIATDGRLDTAAKHPGLSDPEAYGAALLSSSGEICRLRRARIRALDIHVTLTTEYDLSRGRPTSRTVKELGQ